MGEPAVAAVAVVVTSVFSPLVFVLLVMWTLLTVVMLSLLVDGRMVMVATTLV